MNGVAKLVSRLVNADQGAPMNRSYSKVFWSSERGAGCDE
ncbi:hypothetical protein ES705_02228 [subsurface metagenome]